MPSRVKLYPWLLWIAMILQGLLFISTTAVWDGFDEPFHYAYIQFLAETGTLLRPSRALDRALINPGLRLPGATLLCASGAGISG